MAMEKAGVKFEDLSAIAVTRGPGLGLCLEVGILKAKALVRLSPPVTQHQALQHNLPVVAVNHMEGHALISRLCEPALNFPFITFLISGGTFHFYSC